MLIVIISGLVLASVVMVVGWYVTVWRRARHQIITKAHNELPEAEARRIAESDHSIQTEPAPEKASVRLDGELANTAELPRYPGEYPSTTEEADLTLPAQPDVPGASELGPTVTETERPPEIELLSGVQGTEAAAEAHSEKAEVGVPEPAVVAENESPSTTEPITGGEEQGSRETEERPLRKRAPVSPEKRGGRSRAGAGERDEQTRTSRPPAPKPEIVCWKREREWVLAVEIPEEVSSASVLQNGTCLAEDQSRKRCWPLAELGGEVVVSAPEGERQAPLKIVLGDQNCLVFKLSGAEGNKGRRVKRPAFGSFLAIAPMDWKRDEDLAGPAPVEPEAVYQDGYRAHFFYLEADGET